MPIRISEAHWSGGLNTGKGIMQFGSGTYEGSYSAGSRFDDDSGSNPEELIGAAHAACFSMALAMHLEQAGHKPEMIETRAAVHLDSQNGGYKISLVELHTKARVPGISEEDFTKHTQTAKADCPVSQALAGTDVTLKAQLES
jgi:osmotically inducible protein OsmC